MAGERIKKDYKSLQQELKNLVEKHVKLNTKDIVEVSQKIDKIIVADMKEQLKSRI